METKPFIIDFNPEIGLLTIKFTGDLTVEDIIDSILEANQNLPLAKDLKVISDFRDAESDMRFIELPKLIKPTLKVIKNYNSILNAIIADKPHATALSCLYIGLIKKSNIDYEILLLLKLQKNGL